MKEIHLPTMFLGMNLEHHPEPKSIILHQNMYINKVISDFAQPLEKITAVTPMQGGAELEKATESDELQPSLTDKL